MISYLAKLKSLLYASNSRSKQVLDTRRSKIAARWDNERVRQGMPILRWHQKKEVRRHISRLVAGKTFDTVEEALRYKIRQHFGEIVFRKGVSIGCGTGSKEMAVLKSGLVESFDLYELSANRIKRGKRLAKRMGLEDRVKFHNTNAFEEIAKESVDFVHWNASLHHMFDVPDAVSWSKEVLRPGGLFYLHEYVGPSRFQWSEESINLATNIRTALPDRLLVDPRQNSKVKNVDRKVGRPDPDKVAERDPSESVDSSRILESIERTFPEAIVIPTGGAAYRIALGVIIGNFSEDDQNDMALLDLILAMDKFSIDLPGVGTLFAVAFAQKTT